MPLVESLVVGGATAAALSAASASYYGALKPKPPSNEHTLEGLKTQLTAATERIRSKSDEPLTPASPTRRGSKKHVAIFSYGDVAGVSVLLPEGKNRVGRRGLVVTKVLKGAWADSCGAKTGSRLVAVDGVPLEGRTAAEVRRVVSLASRPLWLDIVGGPSPKAEKLAGEHMLL